MHVPRPCFKRFCFIMSEYCLRIFIFTKFPGWFWCTCAVNSISKNIELGPLWEDSWYYRNYIFAFWFAPHPFPSNLLTPLPKPLSSCRQGSCMTEERLEVPQRGMLPPGAPSHTQLGLSDLPWEAGVGQCFPNCHGMLIVIRKKCSMVR